MRTADQHAEDALIKGEVIQTFEKETDMDGHLHFLEKQMGGPLTYEVPMQTDLEMVDKQNDKFNLYEVGEIEDKCTWIDDDWRRETRPKRIRPKSAQDKQTDRLAIKQRKALDEASFDTSSHHTIDYLVEQSTAKSYTYGQDRKYIHIKKQRPVKRSLSAHNFNWNILVDRVD